MARYSLMYRPAIASLALAIALFVTPGLAPADDGAAVPSATATAPQMRVTLPELIELAKRGPRAQMARHQTQAAKAQVAEAGGARYPSIEVSSFLAPSPEIECLNDDCTRTSSTDVTLSFDGVFGGARVSAVQPLYTFGKLDSISRAARAAALASTHLEDAVAADLALEAARAYYGRKLARELVWMLEDGLAEIDKAQATLAERLEEGSSEVTVQDRLRVETLRAEVLARLSEAREAEATALAAIAALAGGAARDGMDVDDEPLEPLADELAPLDAYLARAAAARPELRAASAGAEAAKAKREFEAARYWPDLVAVGDVNVARAGGVDDPPSAFARDPFNTTSAGVALALRWQLDFMRQRAKVAQAEAQEHQAGALRELAGVLTTFEVRRAYAQASQAKARMEATKEGEKSARGWVASVVQADMIGVVSAKDLADALIAYFTLRARHVTSVYEWNLARFALRRAAGEFVAAGDRP